MEEGGEVKAPHERIDLAARTSPRVERADERPHARADHGSRPDAEAVEHAQHADVGETARAATGEHQRERRAVRFAERRGTAPLRRGRSADGCEQESNGEGKGTK